MTPAIRIDEDVMKKLQAYAVSMDMVFRTPNEVLRRMLGIDEKPAKTTKGKLERALSNNPKVHQLLTELLNRVTNEFGTISFDLSRSGKWISKPSNFMTYKAQNYKGNVALTVYGLPESFRGIGGSLEIKKDRDSYSRFSVNEEGQISAAIRVIRQSRDLWLIAHKR